ncbi:hypothetical protein ACET3Z_013873 [Daucus carota]
MLPHVESSDSEALIEDSLSEGSDSDSFADDSTDDNTEEYTCKHFHESGNNLVEFYSRFESAMDKQRLRNDTDDKRSQETPHMEIDDVPKVHIAFPH